MERVKYSRVFAVLLAFAIVVGTLPLTALSASAAIKTDGLVYKISDGEAIVTGCDTDRANEVIIPDTVEGYPVTGIGNEAFAYCEKITSISIPEGVTSIGSKAFFMCFGLGSVNIPKKVTSIGDEAFFYCTRLGSITIPGGVTSIGVGTFFSCSGLTSVTIPDSVTSIGNWAFHDCSMLTEITLPKGITAIGNNTFLDCIRLTRITIPNGVTYIGDNAFSNCKSLATLYYKGTTEQWTDISIAAGNESFLNSEVIFLGSEEPEYIPGDVNGDGTSNSVDSNILKRAVAGSYEIEKNTSEYLAADFNGDGYVNSVDSNLLKRVIVGAN